MDTIIVYQMLAVEVENALCTESEDMQAEGTRIPRVNYKVELKGSLCARFIFNLTLKSKNCTPSTPTIPLMNLFHCLYKLIKSFTS